SIEDYYGQLKCLNELDGFLRTTFRKHFAVMGGWEQKKVVGTRNDEEFAQILARCSFRATKDAWRKELPPRIISTVKVEMTPAQRRHYLEMKNDFITKIKDEKIKADLVLTQLAKLRQISSGIVINSGKETKIEEIENNPKFKALLELYNGQKGKVIVVYTYKLTGKMLGDFFTREKIGHVYIAGQMEPAHLAAQKHAFNNDPNCRVILCQQAAACMGHTLLGGTGDDRCATMIFVENSFALRDRLQMLDRNHRGEQDQVCTVYDLVASSIERKIIQALNEKKAWADMTDELVAALSNNSPFDSLTKE